MATDQLSATGAQSRWPERWREAFRTDLILAGFVRADTKTGVERWEGSVVVGWDDPEDGARRSAMHTVAIELPSTFPFQRPTVRFVGEEVVPGRGHVIREGGASALCLWVDGRYGWRPWARLQEVLERIQEWLGHRYRGDWAPIDQPPDVHAYYPVSPDVAFMLTGNDWPPPSNATEGRFGLWRRSNVATLAAGPTMSLTTPPATAPLPRERFALTTSGQRVPGIGLWYRLPFAPVSGRTLEWLFEILDILRQREPGGTLKELRSVIGDKVAPGEERLYFALGYPDTGGTEHWVFLYADLSTHRRNWRTPDALKAIVVYGMEAAPATQKAIMRRTGHMAEALAGRRIAIFGAGSLGGSIALWLAKAGVPALDLIDSDQLRPGNVIRHVAGLSMVGQLKTMGLAIEIAEHAPDCNVSRYFETWDVDSLRGRVAAADVVADATAVPAFGLLLNEICLEVGRPHVSAAAFHRARLGRVRVIRPGLDACVLCYEGGYVPFDPTYPVIPPGEEGAFLESGCGVPTIEATALDVDAAANVAARAVLHLLREQHAGGTLADAPNHTIIVNERVSDLVAGPHGALLTTPGIHTTMWPSRQGCDACGDDYDAAVSRTSTAVAMHSRGDAASTVP